MIYFISTLGKSYRSPLLNHHVLKTYGGVEVKPDTFETLLLDRNELPALRIGCFLPGKGTRCLSDKRLGGGDKSHCSCWGLNPSPPVRSQYVYCLSYRGITGGLLVTSGTRPVESRTTKLFIYLLPITTS